MEALEDVVEISIDSQRIQDGIIRARKRTWEQVVEDYVSVYHKILSND